MKRLMPWVVGVALLLAVLAIGECRYSSALDQRAAAEVAAIRARAKGEPVVIVEPGPVRVIERERVVVQRVAPGARPVGSATVETTATATGAPVVDCPQKSSERPADAGMLVRCPEPDLGCRTAITGWRHAASGAVLATGSQTLRWRWPGQDWRESVADLTPQNTRIEALPMVLQPDTPPRWIAGFSVGLDDNADKRASVYGLRRIGAVRGRSLYASASGMVGGGDVVVTAGLAAGW